MECPNCGSYNDEKDKAIRCSFCNERLPHRCPYCGSGPIVWSTEPEKENDAPIGCLLDPLEWLILPFLLIIMWLQGDKKKDVWYCSNCNNKLRRKKNYVYLPSAKRSSRKTLFVVCVVCVFIGLTLVIPAFIAYPGSSRTMLLGIGWTLILLPIITFIAAKIYRARKK